MEAGAAGITCAKVTEAEIMADGGLDDIFIAYPLVGELRISRAIALSKRVKRLILGVDSLKGAAALNEMAAREGEFLEVRMEIDTGRRRTGVNISEAADLAVRVAALSHLRLTGIFTFKSLMSAGERVTDIKEAALEEAALMRDAGEAIRGAGIDIADISAGSTPTGAAVARTGIVNEIRPGTYIFNDYLTFIEGHNAMSDIAARICATVVSVSGSRAVIDGGSKTFPMDTALNSPPFFIPSYAMFAGRDGLALTRLNEEHGMIDSLNGKPTGLAVGQIVELIPPHICPAINMHNSVYLLDDDTLRREPVAARGALF
jgi:D-serine deaminase-like pyridoxal phosphate-dependent protein